MKLKQSSTAQISANRRNAQRSNGPITAEGKKKVSQNAVRHGILTCALFVDSTEESAEEHAFAALLSSLKMALVPEGAMEELLVEKVAISCWRLRRTVAFEAILLEYDKMWLKERTAKNELEGEKDRSVRELGTKVWEMSQKAEQVQACAAALKIGEPFSSVHVEHAEAILFCTLGSSQGRDMSLNSSCPISTIPIRKKFSYPKRLRYSRPKAGMTPRSEPYVWISRPPLPRSRRAKSN